MAQLGWMVIEGGIIGPATVRARFWHPAFLPTLWRAFTVQPAFLKPFLVLYLWVRLMIRLGR